MAAFLRLVPATTVTTSTAVLLWYVVSATHVLLRGLLAASLEAELTVDLRQLVQVQQLEVDLRQLVQVQQLEVDLGVQLQHWASPPYLMEICPAGSLPLSQYGR